MAAFIIAIPPAQCTLTISTPKFAKFFIPPLTVFGISCNFKSKKIWCPISFTVFTISKPHAYVNSIPIFTYTGSSNCFKKSTTSSLLEKSNATIVLLIIYNSFQLLLQYFYIHISLILLEDPQ